MAPSGPYWHYPGMKRMKVVIIGAGFAGLDAAKALKRSPHRYSLEQFGLSQGEVSERLGDYVRTYDIPSEADLGHLAARRRGVR